MAAESEESITVAVDRAECIGAGQCVVVAPHAFRLDAVMKAEVIDPEAEPLERLLEAAALCPTRAIYIARGPISLFPPPDEHP